jgi:hypothetical protein
LFQFVTGMLPLASHRAMADVKATSTIFRFQLFFETKMECIFKFSEREEDVRVHEARLPVNDSELEGSGNSQCDESVSSSPSTTEEEDNNEIPLGDTWDQGIEFQPMEPNPSQRFEEYCASTARSRCQGIGLQCSPIDVNTPIRAWREIFKNTLIDKIVRYTNEYGLLHSKQWKGISKKDLESFFALLFILGIKKKKTNHQIGFPTTDYWRIH